MAGARSPLDRALVLARGARSLGRLSTVRLPLAGTGSRRLLARAFSLARSALRAHLPASVVADTSHVINGFSLAPSSKRHP